MRLQHDLAGLGQVLVPIQDNVPERARELARRDPMACEKHGSRSQ